MKYKLIKIVDIRKYLHSTILIIEYQDWNRDQNANSSQKFIP